MTDQLHMPKWSHGKKTMVDAEGCPESEAWVSRILQTRSGATHLKHPAYTATELSVPVFSEGGFHKAVSLAADFISLQMQRDPKLIGFNCHIRKIMREKGINQLTITIVMVSYVALERIK